MPRKPNEEAPHAGEGKMDEETGRRLYGGSGSHQGPGKLEKEEEGIKEGHDYSGASRGGSGKKPGAGST